MCVCVCVCKDCWSAKILVYCYINICRLFNLLAILAEELSSYNLIHAGKNVGFNTLPKDISPKMNSIAQLKFELGYDDVAVQHVNY